MDPITFEKIAAFLDDLESGGARVAAVRVPKLVVDRLIFMLGHWPHDVKGDLYIRGVKFIPIKSPF